MTHHCKNRELTVRMAAAYELDAKEVSFVTGSGKDTNKVQSIVEDAEELLEEQTVEHSGSAFFQPEGADESDDDDASGQETLAAATETSDGVDETGSAGDASDSDDEADADENQSGLNDFF